MTTSPLRAPLPAPWLLLAVLITAACEGSETPDVPSLDAAVPDGGRADAPSQSDVDPLDAGSVDGGADAGPVTPPVRLILLQQRVLRHAGREDVNWPPYVASRLDFIRTLPFDGIAILSPVGLELMNGALHGEAEIRADFEPLRGADWGRVSRNFAVVNVRRPADFMDDTSPGWANAIESFRNFANVMEELGIPGILFDNEDYRDELWVHPDTVDRPDLPIADYYARATERGRAVMDAITLAYPAVRFMVLYSPAHSCAATPSGVDRFVQSTFLDGAFTVGLMQAATAPVIDGCESGYYYRTDDEVRLSYDWRRVGMPSVAADCPFIPTSFRPMWSDQISISFGVYNLSLSGADEMTPAALRTVLESMLTRADEYVWQYWEEGNWFEDGGIPPEWVDAVRAAYETTRAPR